MKKNLKFLLFGAILVLFFGKIFANLSVFKTPYDPSYWQARYEKSQWAKGWEAEALMGDAELYAYAGWRQIQGDDPTKINAEVPPLGRYLIGASIFLFKNPNVCAPIIGGLLLLVLYFFSKRVLKDETLALLPVLTLVASPLFLDDLTTSMLDLPFALFVSLAFYFLAKGRENPRFYLFSVLSLAAVAATKMYQAGFILAAIFGFYLLFLLVFYQRKDFFWFMIFLPFFAVFYVFTYAAYFARGHSLLDFKELHFWIRHFARVQVANYPKGEIFRILLLGRWQTWWGGSGIIKVNAWQPWWVLGFLAIFPSAFSGFVKKNFDLLVLSLWPISLLLMFSYGVSYPRYLLPVLPPLYLLLWYNLKVALAKWRK